VLLNLQKSFMSLTQKYIKLSSNFDLLYSLNFSYENFMGCKNLRCFEFSRSSFLIFKNNVKILNILLFF
jgi:hypothetical protein